MEEEAKTQETVKVNMTGAYLSITLSGFTLLWLAAMGFISLFDSVALFCLISTSSIGYFRGGVKEFFGFFGAVASFLFAINGYSAFYKWTKFNFGTGKQIWGEVCWFFLLLGSGWILCRFLSYYIERSISQKTTVKLVNRIIGSILGGIKGLLLSYVFIILFTNVYDKKDLKKDVRKKIEKNERSLADEFRTSKVRKIVEPLEKRYHLLENLNKMQLAKTIRDDFINRSTAPAPKKKD